MEKSNYEQRILQTDTEPKPIRITTDYSMLTNKDVTLQQRNYLVKLVEISKLYFQKLLKVYQLKQNNVLPQTYKGLCDDHKVQPNDYSIGIPNSDLHIYTLYQYVKNDQQTAIANFCAFAQEGISRPIFGYIKYNLSKISGDEEYFQKNLKETFREMINILGVSKLGLYFWINPDTGKTIDKDNLTKIYKKKQIEKDTIEFITSKHLKEITRKYYNCPKAEGMKLQIDKYQRYFEFRWDLTILYNEFMNQNQVLTDNVFSIFTIAALKDTGFYAEVNENMAEKIFWGKGKGCDFLENTCQSTIQYDEYSYLVHQVQCSFDYERIGIPILQEINQCNIGLGLYKDKLCTNPNIVSDQDEREQEQDKLFNYSTQSKCFQSTATKSSSTKQYKDASRCHQFKCSSDASEITIIFPEIDLQVICGKGEQNTKKDIDSSGEKAKGQVTCPQDYERFCNYTPICSNFCSQKGVCVNGQCICQDGFGGVDCSIECSGVVDNNTCLEGQCPQGKFLNPDNTCKLDCPLGLFGKDRICKPCHRSCSKCKGPLANECTKCQFMTLLQESQCVDKCDQKRGYSPNYDLGVCEYTLTYTCEGNCKICSNINRNLCITCKEGFQLNDNNNQCLNG
ncbi:leishmanolysin family protein, putative [Ichthyophthirius multifiliis]|uniref:Leishmanolysin family protein, putative n=1 Tax=Ichthyophthirius multifiliis TaxID=5932 RepID=G0QZJ1_ICHMU|nr:leishmanolysin family protein, putative [Ichthyophthirius multifiliis]EGR29363.1 leishmanolysin family protein, putative [Ichthyophthirius multifiliis]|eukprot:XP_004030599.1 leishmanolysin family protein, putative [Ichthyophthirius multifiliis]